MADMKRYKPFAFLLGPDSVPFTGLNLGDENQEEELKGDGSLYIDDIVALQKKPVLTLTLLDPSLVNAWQGVGSAHTITSLTAVWRAIVEEGGPAGDYISAAIANGVIMPVSLAASFSSAARLEVRALARYSAGNAITIGTATGAVAKVAKAYRIKELVIGGDTIGQVRSLSANWQYEEIPEETLEPEHYGYMGAGMSGSAELSDLALINEARLTEGVRETVTATFEDIHVPGDTFQFDFGICYVKGSFSGDAASVTWKKVSE